MIKLTLVSIWAILCAILFLAINIYAIVQVTRGNKKPRKPTVVAVPDIAIEEMEKIVQDKNSAIEALKAVIEALIAHHTIEAKKDGKTSKGAKRLLDLIFTMAGHKNMSTDLRADTLKRFGKANPSYAKDFDRALTKN
ncbi:MAG: hypothetical protein LBP89_04865 [Helicobacteraceae bacterium]|jgi:Na+-transporting methylmalonyl-CoA/oxaloacetate decarboxylase gamma subunit|nr:hypothetical protein [Helicobacteraceae bacterium]